MKKILLINPAHDNEHEIYKHTSHRLIHRDPPPLGALSIGTYLANGGYDVEILDTHIEEHYLERLQRKIDTNQYLFIGMTVFIGKFLKNAVELGRIIRDRCPQTPIVWGGVMASIFPEELLREYPVDYIVRYEGEETALELAGTLESGRNPEEIDGLSFWKARTLIHTPPRLPKTHLDQYPIPRWELLGKALNRRQDPYFHMIMSSRGCPFNCTFCYKHSFDSVIRESVPAWRARSAGHIMAEVDSIHERTGSIVFTFGDDNFFVKKQRALEVLEAFRQRGFFIEECVGHLNCLDSDLIEAMGGVVQTFIFSVESGSPRIQEFINKNLDLNSIPDKLQRLYRQGIVTNSPFIIGFPTEEKIDLRQNIELMMTMKNIHPFARGKAYFFLPLPKTKLFETTQEIHHITLPNQVRDYEEANIWVENLNDPIGMKFRPWLSQAAFNELVLYCLVFNDIFKTCNLSISDRTRTILAENPELNELFKGHENIHRPHTDYRPYILGRLLNGEKIDLRNDLHGK